MIARAPDDLQSIMDAIAENAARLCEADDALVRRLEGDATTRVSHFGAIPIVSGIGVETLCDRSTPAGRAVMRQKDDSRPRSRCGGRRVSRCSEPRIGGWRSNRACRSAPPKRWRLSAPFTYAGLKLARFPTRQIHLLETFADQAVIAIENARLIHEQQARNRDLAEALEQQTATSEILGVISSSPTSLDPVFHTILSNITQLCESHIAHVALYDGEALTVVAQHGTTPEFAHFLQSRRRPSRETPTRLAALELRTIHVTDLLSDPKFSPPSLEIYQKENVRTVLSVPMLSKDRLIGVMTTWRREVRQFTEKQIALVQTFADQAVIAIENVRLFKELGSATRTYRGVGAADRNERGVAASSPLAD